MLREYAAWADRQIGRWKVEADGHKSPSVRVLFKPLLGMFHGEPRGKKWRAAVSIGAAGRRGQQLLGGA